MTKSHVHYQSEVLNMEVPRKRQMIVVGGWNDGVKCSMSSHFVGIRWELPPDLLQKADAGCLYSSHNKSSRDLDISKCLSPHLISGM